MLGNDERLDSCSAGIEPRRRKRNSSFDVDGVVGRVTNCKHGIESEDEKDKVGGAQERSQEKVGIGDVGVCGKRQPERLRVVGGRWTGWGAERRSDSSKRVRGKSVTNPSDSIDIPSQRAYTFHTFSLPSSLSIAKPTNSVAHDDVSSLYGISATSFLSWR